MDKRARVIKYFQNADQLTLKNIRYRQSLHALFKWLLQNDAVERDITTKLFFSDYSQKSIARILARSDTVVAGALEISFFLKTFTRLDYKILAKDGAFIKTGEGVLELTGEAYEILSFERVMLNILQRLMGIATQTQRVVARLDGLKLTEKPLIAATRKTAWAALDKKAVAVGGGVTHRLTLSDWALVKDNHLVLMEKMFNLSGEKETAVKALSIFLKKSRKSFMEIEVEKKDTIEALIKTFLSHKTDNVLGIMLDNFSAALAKNALTELKKKYDLSRIIFEASGGITAENLMEWAQSGVDVISLGALTHSVKSADLSLGVR